MTLKDGISSLGSETNTKHHPITILSASCSVICLLAGVNGNIDKSRLE